MKRIALCAWILTGLAACDDPAQLPGPPTETGTLVVSTSTVGDDPDQDGYLLTVDEVDSLEVKPMGTAVIALAAGRHTLNLLGVASQCSVAAGTVLEVEVSPRDTTPVMFAVTCPASGARVTITTTGLDFGQDEYRVAVDGGDRGIISRNATVFIRLEAGSRTIALTGLPPNCAVDGPGSRTVTIVTGEVAPIQFAVICTATTGVIGVRVSGSGAGAEHEVRLDGVTAFLVRERGYAGGVSAGNHVVSLVARDNCTVKTEPQPVTVTAGTLVRDTVELTFSTSCETAFLVNTETIGPVPAGQYSVWLCYDAYYCRYGPRTRLGSVDPNGTLLAPVDPGTYRVFLADLPLNCEVVRHSQAEDTNPTDEITLVIGGIGEVTFHVTCTP